MAEDSAALFAQIREMASKPAPTSLLSGDVFLQSVLADETIQRCADIAALLSRAHALGAVPPADVAEIGERADWVKKEAVTIKEAAEVVIARVTATSKYIVAGIEQVEVYSNEQSG
ncbi:hypothetical protein [Mycobacteroides abscessus]|uniref:hypothetical protein n=1 Tax=Mycobacteroides abscessus TaxID=36809 RepID=UPI00189692E2|nr:hypothetical protein [Mycobacteroides abscessus]MDO2972781.1 hypothetical protein [Mycobacteroides abscessus subsp. bolletii]MDO3081117.1 hypothetical protein [Mycobacteroides abscessus subsp. bolletii]MDO3177481.1 hypothetical protein [Mycobacteroides abscessus subsp. abscessus]